MVTSFNLKLKLKDKVTGRLGLGAIRCFINFNRSCFTTSQSGRGQRIPMKAMMKASNSEKRDRFNTRRRESTSPVRCGKMSAEDYCKGHDKVNETLYSILKYLYL